MKANEARKAALAAACALAVAWPVGASWARHRRVDAASVGRRLACETFRAATPRRIAKAGDTLWSITAEVTGKPWVWPQIWALNPEMTNPHWLMIGQTVHFVPRPVSRAVRLSSFVPSDGDEPDELASSEATDGGAGQEYLGDAAAAATPPLFTAGTRPGATAAEAATNSPAADGNASPASPAASASASSSAAATASTSSASNADNAGGEAANGKSKLKHPPLLPAAMFSADEAKKWPTLVSSSSEGLLWDAGERVTIVWPEHRAAEAGLWAAVRTSEGPDRFAEGSDGVLATATGIVEVLGDGGKLSGHISFVREEVEAGQRLIPIDQMAAVEPVPRSLPEGLCGQVTALEHAAIAGSPLHLALFDRGEKDGLQLGGILEALPTGRIGEDRPRFMVVRLGEHAASLQPLRAGREFSRGLKLCGAPSPTP